MPRGTGCRHHDVQIFDNMRCCLACGETVFDSTPDNDTLPWHAEAVPYQYSKLNYALGQEIRLVVLFPGQQSDDIAIDIVHVNLNDKPTYEALSYSWATEDGDDSLSQTVYCRGRTISVTKHCEYALRCLRTRGNNRYLWVDAIAIDQGNIAERNHQVAFMSEIYRNASQVLIYLGPGDEYTDKILDFLNGDAQCLHQIKRDKLNVVVRRFLQKRWFDRVWVLQEVAFARLATLIAGDKATHWTSVAIKKLLELGSNLEYVLPSALYWEPATQPDLSLLDVLHRSRNCSASDPRDKVFAVLGLMSKKIQDEIQVDYSLSHEDIFTNLTIRTIEKERSFEILRYCTRQDSHVRIDGKDHPSWVPRWDLKVHFEPLPRQTNTTLSMWSFSTTELDQIFSEVGEEVLQSFFDHLPGDNVVFTTAAWRNWLQIWRENILPSDESLGMITVDKMALLLTRIRAPSFDFALCDRAPRLDGRALASWNAVYTVSAPRTSNFPSLRTRAQHIDEICVTTNINFYSQATIQHLATTNKDLFGKSYCCTPCKDHFVAKPLCQKNPSISLAMIDEFSRDMKQFGTGKTLFTSQQSVGFTQANMWVKDSIWALPGADTFFVLRSVDEHFILIGECYLYRALRHHPCACCGGDVKPWRSTWEIIDIW
ncbi:HET-domain-containing protein [Byssothecium circinans]|uniref:HET-domain-containing protein n=1 Tax=Byssothecium circinans TaxID=147558 RepID=A0A6A5U519_9PLEO|nr:HET-domain-containing protein [Byssothecium circinans]